MGDPEVPIRPTTEALTGDGGGEHVTSQHGVGSPAGSMLHGLGTLFDAIGEVSMVVSLRVVQTIYRCWRGTRESR